MEEESRNKEEEMREGEEAGHGVGKNQSKMSRITVGSGPAAEEKVGSEQQTSNLMPIWFLK